MKEQQLFYLVLITIQRMSSFDRLKGVMAFWKNDILYLSYYFDDPISDEDREDASIASGEIIANFPQGTLEERYISLPSMQPLPISSNWAYIRKL